jgi:hypothetical protein
MNLILGILSRLSQIVLFSNLQSSGLTIFILLSGLPFIGFLFFGWSPQVLFISYFIDRLIYLFFYFLYESVTGFKSKKLSGKEFGRLLIVYLVSSYMLLQLLGLLLMLFSYLFDESSWLEIQQVSAAIFLLYGFQWITSIKNQNNEDWKPTFFKQTVGIVLLSGATLMISLVAGVFLRNVIDGTFLASFFKSGLGIMLFVFIGIRFLIDAWFLSRKAKKNNVLLNQQD